jgi:hypothetical protein
MSSALRYRNIRSHILTKCCLHLGNANIKQPHPYDDDRHHICFNKACAVLKPNALQWPRTSRHGALNSCQQCDTPSTDAGATQLRTLSQRPSTMCGWRCSQPIEFHPRHATIVAPPTYLLKFPEFTIHTSAFTACRHTATTKAGLHELAGWSWKRHMQQSYALMQGILQPASPIPRQAPPVIAIRSQPFTLH